MRDPFPAPIGLVQASEPLARTLSLRTLPLHVHEILPAFGFYTFLYNYVSPPISRRLFPGTYASLSKKTRVNWDVHAVSLFQSCFVNVAALAVICLDRERWNMGPRERIWGYTGATGMIQGFSAGYFLWDLMMSAKDMGLHGPGALVHAASALAVSMLGFVSSLVMVSLRNVLMRIPLATILQLLWLEFHPLRALHTLSQHPLVYGQAWDDWLDGPTNQWYYARHYFWFQSSTLGHVSVCTDVSGHLDCVQNTWRLACTSVACTRLRC